MASSRVLVTGEGGFIGHHLVKRLKADGHWVRGAPAGTQVFQLVRTNTMAASERDVFFLGRLRLLLVEDASGAAVLCSQAQSVLCSDKRNRAIQNSGGAMSAPS